jgi:FHS family L-fucose permease-like MFS transporter
MEQISPQQSVSISPNFGDQRNALTIITLLFFMWGLLTSLNDVLIPHLKALYSLSYIEAMLVQFCFFGAYFLVSIPAGELIKRIGYQNGVVAGLATAACGCVMFYPASYSGYWHFLLALFVLASGITILQVAANPYVTALGDPSMASSRLTLTQAFNALGTTIAPALGGMLILSGTVLSADDIARLTPSAHAVYQTEQANNVQVPYLLLAATLAVLALIFSFARLPNIQQVASVEDERKASLWEKKTLLLGTIGIFLYVGAEVSIGSFLINYIGSPNVTGLAAGDAAHYVSYYWGGAMLGRFAGFALMRHIRPGTLLGVNAAAAIVLIIISLTSSGAIAMWTMLAVGLCNSIMFPTIFSMALYRLGGLTGKASGVLCMAIVGGALVPFVQGGLADMIGLGWSFTAPAACYVYILFFGLKFSDLYDQSAEGGK